jgi:antitoxin (DNA-binding transcriptional repressor) of toxin-antitoxin stability system
MFWSSPVDRVASMAHWYRGDVVVGHAASASSPGPAPWSGAGRIAGPDDVARVLSAVNAGATRRANTAELLRAVDAGDNLGDGAAGGPLPVHPLLAPLLLPWSGLRRGATVAVTGGASLLLALLDGAMSTGGWAAVAGLPALGVVAAHEHGIPVARLALVPHPGPDWPVVVAALLDGLDMVVVAPPANADATTVRMLAARARARGAVLVTTRPWVGYDLTLRSPGTDGLGRAPAGAGCAGTR